MGSIPIARSISAVLSLLCAAALAAAGRAAAEPAPLESAVSRGNAAYFRGEHDKALAAYRQALAISSTSVDALLNGAVVLDELGRSTESAAWLERASRRSEAPEVLSALGWTRLRAGDLAGAATDFARAVARDPAHARSWLGLGRAELEAGRPDAALKALRSAAEAAPLLKLVAYYRGRAYEALGAVAKAEAAYREAVIADSYFIEGRDAMARVQMKGGRYNEAWRQASKILDSEPGNKRYWTFLQQVQPLVTKPTAEIRPLKAFKPVHAWEELPPPNPRVSRLRVGIGTTPMGKPRARDALGFRVTSDFLILDAKTGRRLAQGSAGQFWRARLHRFGKKRLGLAFANSAGKTVLERDAAVLLRPRSPATGVIALDEDPGSGPDFSTAWKVVRGDLELAVSKGRLRLVNVLDLESYTHGVVSAEMPIQSPIEALKAQAVIARSHALFIQKVTRRHRREGFDVCDEQHCQVYGGLRAESPRSRDIVNATRGRIVTYKGRVAHVIYSSNCGGHTQSGRSLTGWGDVAYWTGVPDSVPAAAPPAGPWALREWLLSTPAAFCKPSSYVHPAHYRWSRILRWADVEEKLARKFKGFGKLKAVRALRRSPSGHVNLLLVEGSKRSVRIDSEMQIRGILGIGSLRSTLFVFETDDGTAGRPEALVVHGAGWGHAVGLCQSGAMGRAEAGQTYEEIVKAYFKGTELGDLRY